MKKTISILIVIAMIMGYVNFYALNIENVFASEVPYDSGNYRYTINNDKTIKIIYYSGTETNVTIPSYIDGMKVTAIADEAFQKNEMETLSIPGTVSSIGRFAFYNCSNLKKVVISEGVKSIDHCAFESCTKLNEIVIPSTVVKMDTNCFTFTAYYNNESNWENGLLYISNHLVAAKDSISGELNIKKGTISLAAGLFDFNNNITKVNFPNGLKAIGRDTFYACEGLKEINIPDSVSYIGPSCFQYCKNVTSVKLSDSLKKIESKVFSDCYSLRNIEIPSKVSAIGQSAFYACSSLTDITIPEKVTGIGSYAFAYCTSLNNIDVRGEIRSLNILDFEGCGYCTNDDNWEDGMLYLGNYLLSVKTDLKGECIIKEGTKYIASRAFLNCWQISKITIPESVIYIGGAAFEGCGSLSSINIPDNLSEVGNLLLEDTMFYKNKNNWTNNALYLNNHLIAVKEDKSIAFNVPEGTKYIWPSAFAGSNINKVTIPESVEEIGSFAFNRCTNLQYVEINCEIKNLGVGLFEDCWKLNSITLPTSIDSIKENCFTNCYALKTIKYNGSKISWNRISIGTGNDQMDKASVQFIYDTDFVLGDVDNNDQINAEDALCILKYSVKLTDMTDKELLSSDVNEDYIINAEDALQILKHAAGLQ